MEFEIAIRRQILVLDFGFPRVNRFRGDILNDVEPAGKKLVDRVLEETGTSVEGVQAVLDQDVEAFQQFGSTPHLPNCGRIPLVAEIRRNPVLMNQDITVGSAPNTAPDGK